MANIILLVSMYLNFGTNSPEKTRNQEQKDPLLSLSLLSNESFPRIKKYFTLLEKVFLVLEKSISRAWKKYFSCLEKVFLVLGNVLLGREKGDGGLWQSRWKVITDNGAISLQANLTPPNRCQPRARP